MRSIFFSKINKILTILFTCSACIFSMQFANAQTTDSASVTSPDTSLINASADTLSSDTIHQEAGDFKSKVEYTSDDSLLFDVEHEVVYLYGNAIVKYEAMVLKANYIEVNLTNKTLFSTFTLDSSKSKIGIPDFAQGEDKFTADEIRYNFNSKKGKIKGVYTQVGEGYIHGETVKKFDDYEYIRNGKYTTCDLPHPHFSFAANKLKLVGNKKIITGPAYFIIEDVPTPIALPFGYFPNRSNRASGIIFPTYGESANLGFFLKNGGYYFGINDYVDLALTGDVYSKGSWGLQGYSRYASRYHFGGNLSVSYSEIKTSEKELPDYNLAKDFFVKWQHTQDAKARPNSLFSANVNAGSSTYYRNNISSESNYLTNTFQSAITYSKTWAGTPYSFSAGMSHNQNTQTHDITISLPQANFSVNRFSPFKRKVLIGTEKWYEKIGVSYQANLQNQIQTVDSLLFSSNSVDKFRNGIQHNIPISTSVKFLKFFTLTPSFNYIEKWYMKTIEKTFDNTVEALVTDTINGFKAAREYSTSASLNTRIYGLVQFKNSKIMAVRHVLSPTVSFTYRPDFSAPSWNYYKTVQLDATGKEGKYSIFESGIFGGPGQGKTGLLAFNLDNNLEMKVKKATDSADATKKIKIFESLSIGTAYNVAADSMRWSNIGINARTTLFEKLNLSLSSSFDPYITDSIGNRFNRSEWKENHRVARHTSTNFSAGFSLNNIAKNHSSSKGSDADLKDINLNPDEYVDLDIPFNLYVSYSLFYTQQGSINSETTQTLNFNGDLSLTPKWKIIFSSGYDFKMKDLSYTSLGFYRDLHCWEMRLTWIPMGFQESFNFQINVKSAILQDLKLVKKNDIYDR